MQTVTIAITFKDTNVPSPILRSDLAKQFPDCEIRDVSGIEVLWGENHVLRQAIRTITERLAKVSKT